MPTGFAVAGVHMTLAAVLQSCSTVHPVGLYTHHLNCTGAVPPVAAAVSVIVVPGGCGAARSAVTVTAVIGPTDSSIAYGKSANFQAYPPRSRRSAPRPPPCRS